MSSFLSETIGVADSGVFWDVGNIKLWQSTRPNIVLFTAKQPTLLKAPNGRYQVAVSSYTQQQPDGNIKITGGAAQFAITSALQYDPKALQDAKDSWRAAMGANAPKDVQFVPLNVQKGEATVEIDPVTGTPDKAHNDKDVGTPGGVMSFLVELTELGAQQWVQGVKNKTAIPGMVKFQYQYLRMMPPVGSEVILHGKRIFQHLSAALDVSYDGFFYGGSAKLNASWEDMVRNGAIEIKFHGGDLPPDLENLRQTLTVTAANQAREILFNQIFAPKPVVKPAEAGNSGGIFGGANFALKWQHESDAIDFTQTISFDGLTWLKESMDAPLGAIFADLDPSYVTEVQTQQSFPTSIVVDGDPILSDVAVSINFTEGHTVEAPVFGKDGGNNRYIVTSMHPKDVVVKYDAKINYASPRWPIVEATGSAKVGDGGNVIVIKPASWVGRHEIYMFVRDGDKILPPTELTEDDYLIVNVTYKSQQLAAPIRDSAHLSGLDMIEFSYPFGAGQDKGQASFSAFGVIGGKLVRAKDQIIDPDEIAVFVLATKGGDVQLVSKNSVLQESDGLAQRLLEGQARPIVKGGPAGSNGAHPETAKADGKTAANKNEIAGTTIAVEYSQNGPILWVLKNNGERQPVYLHDIAESYPFENSRKQVRVMLDDTGKYASSILVELSVQ